MELYRILISGLVATTVVILLYVPHFKSDQFREPGLVNSLISRSMIIILKESLFLLGNSLLGISTGV